MGFEPMTTGSTRSRNRTDDIQLVRLALCQLSYPREVIPLRLELRASCVWSKRSSN